MFALPKSLAQQIGAPLVRWPSRRQRKCGMPAPPLPLQWRRRPLAPRSSQPTRVICSTLISQALQSVRHPLLPVIENLPSNDPMGPGCACGVLLQRQHRRVVAGDFGIAPGLTGVKPSLTMGFDPHVLARREARALPA